MFAYFSKNFSKQRVNFYAHLDDKRKFLGIFEKILKISDETSIEKLNLLLLFLY